MSCHHQTLYCRNQINVNLYLNVSVVKLISHWEWMNEWDSLKMIVRLRLLFIKMTIIIIIIVIVIVIMIDAHYDNHTFQSCHCIAPFQSSMSFSLWFLFGLIQPCVICLFDWIIHIDLSFPFPSIQQDRHMFYYSRYQLIVIHIHFKWRWSSCGKNFTISLSGFQFCARFFMADVEMQTNVPYIHSQWMIRNRFQTDWRALSSMFTQWRTFRL